MKKYRNILLLSVLAFLLMVLDIFWVIYFQLGKTTHHFIANIAVVIFGVWACGCIVLFVRRGKPNKAITKLLVAANSVSLCLILGFCCLCYLAVNHCYTGNFSAETTLFDNKNVLVLVPHQDDDINLVGGLIEQYTQGSSEVSVVFSTNGDRSGEQDVRAVEVLSALTPLGIKSENIYYLGFGDQWDPQTFGEQTLPHIYNSIDPDAVWTSDYGATATYRTPSIDCYMEMPYTRNNYLFSIQSIILEKMPDTIFVVDFDTHVDHRATDLFFEETLCNILKGHPDYHPTVYKGFCYGTAWEAVDDFHTTLNLLSSKKPDNDTWNITSFGYSWEDRVRFPLSSSNLSIVLLNNSVFQSLRSYASQNGYSKAPRVLNGDKVFWQRRTDSLMYDAEILVAGEPTPVLNDFKLKDFTDISAVPSTGSGVAFTGSGTVLVTLKNPVSANSIYLYDNPSEAENILAGYLSFSDGSKIEFGALRKNGSPTVITFPEKQIQWFEIVPTEMEGEQAGFCEIELYRDTQDAARNAEPYLMALDGDDNFVYDYIIPEGDTASFRICRFPHAEQVSSQDISVQFESDAAGNSYQWENETLLVKCEKGSACKITVSEGDRSTTFGVSNPFGLTRTYLSALQQVGEAYFEAKNLLRRVGIILNRIGITI